MSKKKTVSKQQQLRVRVRECAVKVATFAQELEREYQPAIVLAAINRFVGSRREANRIARERAELRRQQAELAARAARL